MNRTSYVAATIVRPFNAKALAARVRAPGTALRISFRGPVQRIQAPELWGEGHAAGAESRVQRDRRGTKALRRRVLARIRRLSNVGRAPHRPVSSV